MSAWLFQGNPDYFRMDDYLREQREVTWAVRQAYRAPQIAVGDDVFIWRATGKGKAEPGVVALTTVARGAVVEPDDPASLPYWTGVAGSGDDPAAAQWRVRLRVERACVGAKEVVKKAWMADDPVLRDLGVIRQSNATNYPVTPAQARRLAALVRNSGRTWDHDESLAALWAYHRTYGGDVSKRPGSTVSVVALAIGRAVPGVYDKVLDFRSIDRRDDRAGTDSTNQIDQAVWAEFYDAATQLLDGARLEAEFQRLWGTGAPAPAPPVTPPQPRYEDFGQPPDDDPAELQAFARKVRRGQTKFRQKLLELYDNRCAISGWGPPAVLQAAHIHEHATSGVNHTDNGILLRSDLHDLFDEGLLRIDPETMTVRVHPSLRGTPYAEYDGATLRARVNESRPAERFLRARWEAAAAAGATAPPGDE